MTWSRKFEKCQSCGTSSKVNRNWHAGNGLCSRCYDKKYRAAHPDEFAKYGERWYAKNKAKQIHRQRVKRERDNFDGMYKKVLERDGYRCVVCGKTRNIIVHHKDGTGPGAKIRDNSIDMLEALCRGCHMNAHRDALNKAKRKRHNDMV